MKHLQLELKELYNLVRMAEQRQTNLLIKPSPAEYTERKDDILLSFSKAEHVWDTHYNIILLNG